MQIAGAYNFANEIDELTKTESGSPVQLPFVYDAAGNMQEKALSGSASLSFTHDAWNRLVIVRRMFGGFGSSASLAEYQYNGLHQRIIKRVDTSNPGTSGYETLDRQHQFYYTAAWQIAEELIEYEWSEIGPSTVHQTNEYVWGIRHIDDIILRRSTMHDFVTEGVAGTFYHLTDHQFSTVALIDNAANLVERVTYDAYGEARHHHAADLTGDGATTSADHDLIRGLGGSWGEYGIGDLNRDGIVDSDDTTLLNNDMVVGNALPAGKISLTDNIIGYAGYIFNAEMHGSGLYTVRHRVYSPELGRWLTRDPIGYVDGMGLYENVMSSPFFYLDPLGLYATGGWWDYLFSTEDREWEEMMRENQEMLKKKIEDQRCRNLFTDEEADDWQRRVNDTIDDTVQQLDKIRWDVQREIVTEIVLTFVPSPGVHVTRIVRIVNRVVPIRSITRRFPARVNTYPRNIQTNLVPSSPPPSNLIPPFMRRRPGCFVAGTVVLAASGAVAIEDVQAGMEVWSYDHAAEQWELREVERTFEHEYFGDLVNLTLTFDDGSTDEITATGNHPFWVIDGEELADRPGVEKLPEDQQGLNPYGPSSGGRWTEARWLRLGDHFLTRTGKSATVSGLTIRIERVKVYNLQVEDLHLYAVGECGVLVHNSDVRKNKRDGDRFRDQVVDDLRKNNQHEIWTEVRIDTPLGPRVVDIMIVDKTTKRWLYWIETKRGRSRYRPPQRSKDRYIQDVLEVPGCLQTGRVMARAISTVTARRI